MIFYFYTLLFIFVAVTTHDYAMGVGVEVEPSFLQSVTSLGWTSGTSLHHWPPSHLWLQEDASAQQCPHKWCWFVGEPNEGSTQIERMKWMKHMIVRSRPLTIPFIDIFSSLSSSLKEF